MDYETAGKNQTGLLSTAARSEAPRQLPTICDEIHQLAGDTAQGNALGTLAACTNRIVGLTGTLLGGYADDLFNTLFRLEAAKMKEHGYEWGTAGRGCFTHDYGVLETITRIEPENNACSKARTTSTVRRKPGASSLLFGEFLMQLSASAHSTGDLPSLPKAYPKSAAVVPRIWILLVPRYYVNAIDCFFETASPALTAAWSANRRLPVTA